MDATTCGLRRTEGRSAAARDPDLGRGYVIIGSTLVVLALALLGLGSYALAVAFAPGRRIHACSRYEEGRPLPCSTRPGARLGRWSSRARRTPSKGCSRSSTKPRARQTCWWCATIGVWATPRRSAETKGWVDPTIGSGRRRPV